MANFRRRRRRERRNASYGQKSIGQSRRTQRGPAKIPRAIARLVKPKIRAVRRTALQSVGLQRGPLRRRVKKPLGVQPAVRSISLVERSNPRMRGTKKPCIKRPNSRLAGEASVRSGSGFKQTKQARLRAFTPWC